MWERSLSDLKIRSIVDCDIPESYKTLVELEDLFDKLDSSNADQLANRILELLAENTLSSDYISYFLYNEMYVHNKKAKAIVDIAEILLKQGNFELKEHSLGGDGHKNLRFCLEDRGFKGLASKFEDDYISASEVYNIEEPSTIEFDAVWDNFEDFRTKFNENESSRSKGMLLILAELALRYGSVNIFKFLTLNELNLLDCEHIRRAAIVSGNFELIRILVNQGFSFHHHLADAIKYRHNDIADWLIENYLCEFIAIDIPLLAFNTRAVNFLIENDIYNRCDPGKRLCIFEMASVLVNRPIVKTLLAKYGEPICSKDMLAQIALLVFAAKSRDFSLMDYLMERDANINGCVIHFTVSTDRPILTAIKNNDMELFNYCIQHGAHVGIDCHYAMDYIIKNRNIEMLYSIFNPESYFFLMDCQSSIIDAIEAGAFEIAAAFYKADLMDDNKFVHMAINQDSIKTIKYLLNECSDKFKTIVYESLPFVIQYGTLEMLEYFLKLDGIDVNKMDEEGETALITAIHCEDIERVQLILSIDGVDVNAKTVDSKTALFIASSQGNEDIVELLVTVDGIDLNAQDCHGLTALMIALKEGHQWIAQILLSTDGIDVNVKDNKNMTALMIATVNGYTDIVKLLLSTDGIDVNAKDNKNMTALMIATEYSYTDIVKLLLSTDGIDVNAKDNKNMTALMIATVNGYTDIVKLLLSTDGIDVNAQDSFESTALKLLQA